MSTPLLAVGLLSKLGAATRQATQKSNAANSADGSAETSGTGQNVPGQRKFDLQNLFKTLDADKDGKLSQTELKNLPQALQGGRFSSALLALQDIGQASGQDAQAQLFSALDKNGDGGVSGDEFKSLGQGIRTVLHSIGASGDKGRGAASLGVNGLKPAADLSGRFADRDSLNRALQAYGGGGAAAA